MSKLVEILKKHFPRENESESSPKLSAQNEDEIFESVNENLTDLAENSGRKRRKEERPTQRHAKAKKRYRPLHLHEIESKPNFRKFFQMNFDLNCKLSVNHFDVIHAILELTGLKPKEVSTMNKTSFIIEVIDENQAQKLPEIKKIQSFSCQTTSYDRFNQTKGLVYLNEFEEEHATDLRQGLMENYTIVKVEEARFIRTKPGTSAFILTFDQEHLYDIYIPGERHDTRVIPFSSKPMICHNCQQYGHTTNRCRHQEKCRRCASTEHNVNQCPVSVELAKCSNCDGYHPAGDKECPKHINETNILTVQMEKR